MGVHDVVSQRLRGATLGVLGAALLVALVVGAPPVRADIDGDGVDEIGAFAVEVTGSARGPWYQVIEADGNVLADQFLNAAFSSFQFLTVDLDGNGSEELVNLSIRNSDGASLLDVRQPDGSAIDAEFVTGAGFSQFKLFPINYNGGTASEIGIGFIRDSDGVSFYQIWRLNGGTVEPAPSTGAAVLPGTFDSHQWAAGDFDNNGTEELFVGFRRVSDGAAAYQIWNPSTSSVSAGAFVTGTGFTGHKWIIGDFNSGIAGVEALVGFIQSSDGSAAYQVWRGNGTIMGGTFIIGPGFGSFEWGKVSDGTDEQVFVGFARDSDSNVAYQVWDPTSNTLTGAAFVLPGTFQVTQWLTGNFDGVANGGEIVVGFVQNSDGAIGYQRWGRTGVFGFGQFVLAGTFYNPTFVGLKPVTSSRDDVLVGATASTGQPVVQIWETVTGTSALGAFIFNTDVR